MINGAILFITNWLISQRVLLLQSFIFFLITISFNAMFILDMQRNINGTSYS